MVKRAVALFLTLLLTSSLVPRPAAATPAAIHPAAAVQAGATIYVDDDWAALADGSTVAVGAATLTVGSDAFASPAAAVKAAGDGATVRILPGAYGLTSDPEWSVGATFPAAGDQTGWYLPIIQNGLTLQGVRADGTPADLADLVNGDLPVLYGADNVPNGAWASQNLITVFGANVRIVGLTIMPKVEPNKTIELLGANPEISGCLFAPNAFVSTADIDGYDYSAYGGSIYVNGGLLAGATSDAYLGSNYFLNTNVAIDSLGPTGRVTIDSNYFDGPATYVRNADGVTTRLYMVGTLSWANPPVTDFGGALLLNNYFTGAPQVDGYRVIRHRVNGEIRLRDNYVEGNDPYLVEVDTARYGARDGAIIFESWLNDAGVPVRLYTRVDANGVTGPEDPPEPPVVAGSTSEIIGAGGGLLDHEGVLQLQLPAGAVSDDTIVTVAPTDSTMRDALLQGETLVGPHVYDITFESLAGQLTPALVVPATLTVPFSSEELAQISAGGRPYLCRLDPATGIWYPVPGQFDGTTLSAILDEIGSYAVLLKPTLPVLTDIHGHWAERYVLKLVGLGVVGGNGDGTYAPEGSLTRAQAAKLLALSLGLPLDEGAALPYGDATAVPAWAQPYVAAVSAAGLMRGYDDGTFGPNDTLTRAQFAVVIARALSLPLDSAATTTFADDGTIPAWAKSHVAATVDAGIIKGLPGNVFAAAQPCTRGQAAKLICKLTEALQ